MSKSMGALPSWPAHVYYGRLTRVSPHVGVTEPGAYLRRALVNEINSGGRRRLLEAREERRRSAAGRGLSEVDERAADRDAVVRALRQLSPGHRTVLVLRYFEPPERIIAVAFDPAASRWRTLPAPPIGPRPAMLVAWTGDELVIGGGGTYANPTAGLPTHSDAVAFDPVTGAWRQLPDAPAAFAGNPRYRDAVVGQQVVALFTADRQGRPLLLDASTGVWGYGPQGFGGPDYTSTEAPFVSTGDRLLVWGPGSDDVAHPPRATRPTAP
jgi:hypothetical protein